LQTFDPQSVRLEWARGQWQLLADGNVLKEFGHRQLEARQALRVIQDLHLNQHGTVGGPAPVMEYWLADGQAPQSYGAGLRTVPMVPAGLRVEQVHGQWCVRDAQRVLFNFGEHAGEAQQALAVLRKYGFTQVGILGPGPASMMVFLTRPGANPQAGLPGAHAQGSGGTSSRQLTVPTFPRHVRIEEAQPKQVSGGDPGAPKLDGLVSPALPPLSQPAPKKAEGPAWRGQPHFGPGNAEMMGKALPNGERVPFDWRRVEMRQENGNWKLAAGGLVLANFGGDQHEASVALSAVQHYRFTEQWRVAGDFRYFLSNGQAPRGLMLGAQAQSFQPDALAVKQVEGRYALCAGDKVVVRLGQRAEEAQQLLEVIKRNHFDRLCRLGEGAPQGMTFLVRSR